MKATSLMSLAAATVFALGVVGPALAQTPSTPAPSTPAPAAPAKSGDTQMDKMDKKAGKAPAKRMAKKKHVAKKKEVAPATPAPEQPKK